MIPTKIVIKGDLAKGRDFIKFAQEQMRMLEREMSFQNLFEYTRTVKPYPDVIVECWKSHSLAVATITVIPPLGEPGEEVEPEKEPRRECPCYPCFSLGIVSDIRTSPTAQEYREGIRYEYDIEVCTKDSYTLLYNFEVLAAGWEEYYVGQKVLVGIDVEETSDDLPDCCDKTTCIFSNFLDTARLVTDVYSIYPVHITGGMKKWRLIP